MAMLDVLINSFLDQKLGEKHTKEEKALLQNALKQEIVRDVKKQYKAELKQIEKNERAQLKRRRFASFIVEALFLATLVGLVVNQLTNLLEQIQIGMNWGAVRTPIILIVILIAVITWFLFIQIGIKSGNGEELDV